MYSDDEQFEMVMRAVAGYRPSQPETWEQMKARREAARKAGPLHQAAIKRRKKRKRGGPK